MPILEDGQLFERYRIHRWLGSGIAGESYEAEDRILQRKVTLKLIHPWATLADSARRQFFREMQGISLLNHPYLAAVLDYGEIDGRIYVARRYVSSGSLLGPNGRLWFHPPLPVASAFTYAHQLAQALQYIHQHGYAHGSLTFANVLVLRGPNAEDTTDYAPFLVADVSLAHFVRRFGHPRLETLPISASPEQINKRVTPASDQFALAVLLYFWLASRPPYLGASYEIEKQKLSEAITPLSTLNPGVTLEQDALILRALRANPEERHASVLVFAEALIASLTSTNRQYATPASALAPQSETLRTDEPVPSDEKPAAVEAETKTTSVEQESAATAPAEEILASMAPAQASAEPFRSALEELLATPHTRPEHIVASNEASDLPGEEIEEEIEVSQPEEPVLFPVLPETPRVEEDILQADFVCPTIEEIGEPSVPRHTDPLPTEPEANTRSTQNSEAVTSMPLDLPDSPASAPLTELEADASATQTNEFVANTSLDLSDSPAFAPQDEFPPAEEEVPSNVLANEALVTRAETTPTLPPEEVIVSIYAEEEALSIQTENTVSAVNEELSSVPDEKESILSFAEPAHEKNTPRLPLEEPSIEEGEIILSLNEPARSDNEAVHPLNEPEQPDAEIVSITLQAEVSLTEEEEEILTEVIEEVDVSLATTPTVPLQELTAESETAEPVLANEEGTLANTSAEVFPESADVPILAELAGGSTANQPGLEIAHNQEIDLNAPQRELLETTNETYPQIDTAIVAPRLLISSPYTSSSFEFLLVDEEINIGRAGMSDLYLEQDNLTSRHHALLKRIGERVLIFDKRSHNGVFLNGQKIDVGRGYELADGDHIGIGNYELIFRSASTGQISQLI